MVTIEDNQIIQHAKRGVQSILSIKGIDWSGYEIRSHLKREARLSAPILFDLDPYVDGENLVIEFSEDLTSKIDYRTYFDIKLISDGVVSPIVIQGQLRISETITNTTP